MEQIQSNSIRFELLPSDILLHIFSFLPLFPDLIKHVGLTNKALYNLIQSDLRFVHFSLGTEIDRFDIKSKIDQRQLLEYLKNKHSNLRSLDFGEWNVSENFSKELTRYVFELRVFPLLEKFSVATFRQNTARFKKGPTIKRQKYESSSESSTSDEESNSENNSEDGDWSIKPKRQQFDSLIFSEQLPLKITIINFTGNYWLTDFKLTQICSACPNLEQLFIPFCQNLRTLQFSAPNLKILDISWCNFSFPRLNNLLEFKNLQLLIAVGIDFPKIFQPNFTILKTNLWNRTEKFLEPTLMHYVTAPNAVIIINNKKLPLIHFAIQKKDDDLVSFILNAGGNINVRAFSEECGKPANSFYNPSSFPWTFMYPHIHKVLDTSSRIKLVSKELHDISVIHTALLEGRMEMLDFLLLKGAPIDGKDNKGRTPLMIAIQLEKSIEEISKLLALGASINEKDLDGWNSLHYLVGYNHPQAMELANLLIKASTLNCPDNHGMTPLSIAAFNGRQDFCQLLMSKGANVQTYKFEACIVHQVLAGVLEPSRKKKKTKKKSRDDSFQLNSEQALPILELAASMNAPFDNRNKNGATPLILACKNGLIECVQLILKYAPSTINLVDNFGWSALHYVASYSDKVWEDLLLKMLSIGVRIDTRNNFGQTPLLIACCRTYSGVAIPNIMLDAGADPNAVDDNGWTCLHGAALSINIGLCKLLLSKGANIKCSDKMNVSPLLAACRGINNTQYGVSPPINELLQLLELFISYGANISQFDLIDGSTSLHLLAKSNSNLHQVTEFLIKKGAEVNFRDSKLNTPLHYAVEKGNVDLVNLLLKNGSDINLQNFRGFTPFMTMFNGIRIDPALEEYLDEYEDFIITEKLAYPLWHSTVAKNIALRNSEVDLRDSLTEVKEMTNIFLECPNLDFNLQNHDGWTLLHHILDWQVLRSLRDDLQTSYCVVETLIKKGSKIDLSAEDKTIPLHKAITLLGIIQYLNDSKEKKISYSESDEYSDELSESEEEFYFQKKIRTNFSSSTPSELNTCRQIVNLLLQAGSDCNFMNQKGESGFLLACSYGLVDQLKLMLEQYKGNVNLCDPLTHENGLHKLLKSNASIIPLNDLREVVSLLLSHGIDTNAFDIFGKTPLHVAAELGFCSIISLLLSDKQTNPNILEKNTKRTPLMIAASEFTKTGAESFREIISVLLPLAKGDETDWLNCSLESYLPIPFRSWIIFDPVSEKNREKWDTQRQFKLAEVNKVLVERNLRRLRKGRQNLEKFSSSTDPVPVVSPFDQLKLESSDLFLVRKISEKLV